MPPVGKSRVGSPPPPRVTQPPVAPRLTQECPHCKARYPGNYVVCPLDATSLEEAPDADDPLVGTVVGDCYEIVQIVGYGGMATVYEARHTRLPDKRFAIKFLLPEFAVKPEIVIRFGREAETASRIQHPNVVDVYDVHRAHDGTPYIVCEYLDGHELGNMLEDAGRIEADLAVDVARQVCLGLSAAHVAGVVHRDMKPENVFLVGDPAHPLVKVIDFGISKITDPDESNKLTRTGFVMGTPAYMPPEQAKGGVIDHRTDVYGVGAILYRALTGHAPFVGDDPGAVLAAVLTKEPKRPRMVDPAIPEDLELIIERAMAKNPDDRYPSVDAMAADLAEWQLLHRRSALEAGTDQGASLAVTDPSLSLELENPKALAQTTRHARRARPNIVALSAVAFVWLFTGIFEVVVAAVQAAGRTLTGSETWLVFAAIFAVAVTPSVFWVRHLMRRVWNHSVRALRLSHVMFRVVGVGVAGYGGGAILVHLSGALGSDSTTFLARTFPLLASLLAAAGAWLLMWRDQLQGERRGTATAEPG
jgi:serine/threonine-protein kinase